MKNAKLLLSRLNRIEQDGQNLSVQDMLILLTQEELQTHNGFFKRLLSGALPNYWNFPNQNIEEIKISLRLIHLIKDVFIPEYQSHAKKYEWRAQCIYFQIQYQPMLDLQCFVKQHFALIEQCKDLALRTHILEYLNQHIVNADVVLGLAQLYHQTKQYNNAIYYFEMYFKMHGYIEELYFTYISTLIERDAYLYNEQEGQHSDVEYALYLLVNMKNVENQKLHKKLLEELTTILLPNAIVETRSKHTNVFADMGRNFNQLSKGLGKVLQGRESDIPYSDGIIESAPKLLQNSDVLKYLEHNAKAQKELKRVLSNHATTASVGAVASTYSLGLIWDYAHIDSSVLDALTFASKGNPDNFSILQDLSSTTLEKAGAIKRLSGYVAEQQVAYNLHQQGYIVEFPNNANQPGYDLIVDGTPMQVKCSMSSEYVLKHFDRYPDIPVVVNSELAAKLGDHPMVMVDSKLQYVNVQETTYQSLEYLSDFDSVGDLLPIPLLGGAVAAYRNYGEYGAGQIDAQKYAEKVGKETVVVAGGALVGKLIGGSIGAFGGPIGIIVGSGIGAYIGGVAGSTGANTLNREALCDQRDIVVQLLIEFTEWFKNTLLLQRTQHLAEHLTKFENYLRNDVDQIVVSSTFFSYQYESYQRAVQLHEWITDKLENGNEMKKVQAGWVALSQSTHFMSVELRQKINEINKQLEIYKNLANPKKEEIALLDQLQPS